MDRRSALATAVGLTLAFLISAAGTAAGGTAEEVICESLEIGPPGPAGNELQITTTDYVGELTIHREAERILVSDHGDSIPCSGDESPSVTNIDQISVRMARESLDSLFLDQRGGSFAPGATAEADETSEIEISLLEAPGTVLAVIGTPSADLVQLGALGGGTYGTNLNAAAEDVPDADVTARNAFAELLLGGGDDRIKLLGQAAFASGPFDRPFAAFGGAGDDVLIGNDRRNLLWGGRGTDRLVGGGRGDLLLAGRGSDRIEARDRGRDVVDCGPGEDTVRGDPVDRRRHCE